MVNPSSVDQKVSVVLKDLDTAFQVYGRCASQIDNLRGWSLTLLLAYVTFLISIKPSTVLVLVPFVVTMMLFMYLEGRRRREQSFLGNEVRQVERIFMETDHSKFIQLIKEYEFRDLRGHGMRVRRAERIMITSKSVLSVTVVGWYSLLIMLAVAGYFFIHSRVVSAGI